MSVWEYINVDIVIGTPKYDNWLKEMKVRHYCSQNLKSKMITRLSLYLFNGYLSAVKYIPSRPSKPFRFAHVISD